MGEALTAPAPETTVLHVGGLHYASEKSVVEDVLGRRPGVVAVEANPVAQTATVTFDPGTTSVADLRDWIEECGYHCAGRSVPGHICDPMAEGAGAHEAMAHGSEAEERAEHAHGHGHGGHAGMSMEAMERDMRNRFLVALVFTIPIVLWSMVGTEAARLRTRHPVRTWIARSGSCSSACRWCSTRRRSSSPARSRRCGPGRWT